MTVNLRNTSGQARVVVGRVVEPDEVIHVEGDLAKKQPDDAIVIESGGEARAWPTAHWTNAGGSKNTKPDVTTEES